MSDSTPKSSTERRDRVRQRMRRGAYLLPSLFTMGNIWLGFYGVVSAYRGDFVQAAWLVIVAGVLDGLDGRIARLTHTESEFGKEFDSLADVLTFGAAPALMAFMWKLSDPSYGRLGWLVPLFFLLCTTIRLARFNVQTKAVDSRYFVGLPSPAAAGTVTIFFLFEHQLADVAAWQAVHEPLLFGILIVAGSLMVSTFRYPSFKSIDLRRRWSYRSAVIPAVALLVLTLNPALFFQVFVTTYTLWGPGLWLVGRLSRRGTEPASQNEPSLDAPLTDKS